MTHSVIISFIDDFEQSLGQRRPGISARRRRIIERGLGLDVVVAGEEEIDKAEAEQARDGHESELDRVSEVKIEAVVTHSVSSGRSHGLHPIVHSRAPFATRYTRAPVRAQVYYTLACASIQRSFIVVITAAARFTVIIVVVVIAVG